MSNNLNLKVGDKIRIGKKYAEKCGLITGEIIELIEGYFEHDNGLYTECIPAPSIATEDPGEFDSIYHLFGNDLENLMDCEVLR